MGAKRVEELDVWKLAEEVRTTVFLITRRRALDDDRWLRRQVRRSADSACGSVAEGFGRFSPPEFAYFLRVAVGSLEEVKSRCGLLASIGACSPQEAADLHRLASRACGAATNLIKYLKTQPGGRTGNRRTGNRRTANR